jgi:hypothetical protein
MASRQAAACQVARESEKRAKLAQKVAEDVAAQAVAGEVEAKAALVQSLELQRQAEDKREAAQQVLAEKHAIAEKEEAESKAALKRAHDALEVAKKDEAAFESAIELKSVLEARVADLEAKLFQEVVILPTITFSFCDMLGRAGCTPFGAKRFMFYPCSTEF